MCKQIKLFFLGVVSFVFFSCSYIDVENSLIAPSLESGLEMSLEPGPRRHLSDDDLVIRGDSVFIAFKREEAILEGISPKEYDLAQRVLDKLNYTIQTRLSTSRDINPGWSQSIFQVGVIFSYYSDPYNSGYPSSPLIFLPSSYNVRDALGVDCSFASYTDYASPLWHTLYVVSGNIRYGTISGGENQQFSENYYPASFPTTLEYNCPVFSPGYAACAWATYGFNDDLL